MNRKPSNRNAFSYTLRLTVVLAKVEFKLKNEGSYLGILWYLLNPLLLFLLLWTVFSSRLGHDIPSYPLYLLLGLVMFNFFQQATTESARIIIDNRWIIKSIAFPHESLIASIVLKTLFSHIFEIVVLTMFFPLFGIPVTGILFYPLILVLLSLFVAGVSFMLSAFATYFTDLENIWLFASRLLWFATPIFYAIGHQKHLLIVNLCNPMYYFITIARDVILYAKLPDLWMVGTTAGFSLLSLIAGLFVFNTLQKKFAEMT